MAHLYCGCPVKPKQDSINRTQPIKSEDSCNRSIALLGSTSTTCTSKSLIHRVSTSASWCEVMTLDGLTGGKDIGSSIGWITLLLSAMWMVFTRARAVAAHNSLLFWRLD